MERKYLLIWHNAVTGNMNTEPFDDWEPVENRLTHLVDMLGHHVKYRVIDRDLKIIKSK